MELQIRVEQVVGLIAAGKQRSTIQEEICLEWGVKPPTARLYMRKALDHISLLLGQERVKQLAKAVLRYEFLYNQAVEAKELGNALRAQKELCNLLSLDKVQIPRDGEKADDSDETLSISYELTDSL
jgi:hypothetical protein